MTATANQTAHPEQESSPWYNQKSLLSAVSILLTAMVVWYPRVNAYLMESELLSSTFADVIFILASVGLTLINLAILRRRTSAGLGILSRLHRIFLEALAFGALTWTCLPVAMVVFR